MGRALFFLLGFLAVGGQGAAHAVTWCGGLNYATALECATEACAGLSPYTVPELSGAQQGPDANGIYTQAYGCKTPGGSSYPQGLPALQSNPPDVCAPVEGHESSGAVPRASGSTIPPQTLCLAKPGGGGHCRYDLSVAEEGTDLSDGSLVWLGTWVNSGVSCEPEGGGDSVGAGNDTSDYAASSSAYNENQQEKSAWLDALKSRSLAQRNGTDSDVGPFGSFWHPPAWVVSLFTPSSLECELGIQMQIPLLENEAAISATSLCEYRDLIDLYGNFAVWFSAVLWSWSIVTAARVRGE